MRCKTFLKSLHFKINFHIEGFDPTWHMINPVLKGSILVVIVLCFPYIYSHFILYCLISICNVIHPTFSIPDVPIFFCYLFFFVTTINFKLSMERFIYLYQTTSQKCFVYKFFLLSITFLSHTHIH